MVLSRSRGAGVRSLAYSGRTNRYPQHPFNIKAQPWQIAPMFIAPVLPGETMKSLKLQARVATDPLLNQQVGWWLEYMFFYVKLSDLGDDEFMSMMIDPDWTPDAVDGTAAAASKYFWWDTGQTGPIDWVTRCYNRIMDADCGYFRTGVEDRGSTSNGLYNAKVVGTNFLDSYTLDADLTAIDDVDVDLNADSTITVSEIQKAQRQFELLQANGMTGLTWQDYLATFGIKVPKEELHVPELLRFVRHWTYPATVVDPTDGSLAGSCVWNIQESADKDRFFKEPGFLFGVSVARPKVYLSNVRGSLTSYMNSAATWLPPLLSDDPRASWINIPDDALFGDQTDAGGSWVDIKDLFLYGEQFYNYAIATDSPGIAQALPAADGNHLYPADLTKPFAGTAANGRVRQDGIVSLVIAGRQVDTSPPVVTAALTP